MNKTEDKIVSKMSDYTSKSIGSNKKLFDDLRIYGEDMEDLIQELSKELSFDEREFWNIFMENGFYNPSELYLNLPKFFYLDLKELLFHCKLKYKNPRDRGKDISVKELYELIEYLKI